jgi:hypothetical protein
LQYLYTVPYEGKKLKYLASLKLVFTNWTCSNSKSAGFGIENVLLFIWWKRLADRPQEGICGSSAAYPKSESGSAGELGSCHFFMHGLQLLHKAEHKWEPHSTLSSAVSEEDGKFHGDGDLMVTPFSLLYLTLKRL